METKINSFVAGFLIAAVVIIVFVWTVSQPSIKNSPEWKVWEPYEIVCDSYQKYVYKHKDTGEIVKDIPFTDESKKPIDMSRAHCLLMKR